MLTNNNKAFFTGVVLSLAYEILYFICLKNFKNNFVITLILWILLLSVIPFLGFIFERSNFNEKLRSGAILGTFPVAAASIIITVYRTISLKHFDITPLLYLLPSFLGIVAVSILAIYLKKSQVSLRTPLMLSAIYSFLITVPFYICDHIAAITKNIVLSGIGYVFLIIATIGCYLVFRYVSYQMYAEKVFYLSIWSFIISYGVPSCILWIESGLIGDEVGLLYIFYYPLVVLLILLVDLIVLSSNKSK